MNRGLEGYPYLAASLGLALGAGLCYAGWSGDPRPAGRRALLLAALLAAPFALFSFEFIPKYWQPRLLLWFGPASVEDLLFSSATGLLGWCVAAWPVRLRLWHGLLEDEAGQKRIDWRQLAVRFALGAGPGIAVAYALKYGLPGTSVIAGTMWGIAVGGALLFWRERRLWPLAASGGLAFSAVYGLFLLAILHAWPRLAVAWTSALQPHIWLGGVPAYELLWAAGFGAVWPLFVGSCLGTELQPKGPAVAKSASPS
jgi:hypothetical protein